jgi:N-acyl-D-aspartate/D-glutamate deacylase
MTIRDRATYVEPAQAPEGIRDVIVAGVAVVSDGVQTTARPGRVLRAGHPRPGGRLDALRSHLRP